MAGTWRSRLGIVPAALAALLCGAAAAAQDSGLGAPCAQLASGDARERCFAVAQTAESLQPQLGILIAGGNPILGRAGAGGLRLGTIPRLDVSPRLNLTFVRLPDILAAEAGTTAERLNRTLGIPAPAVGATVAVGVLPGFTVSPGFGGVGSVDLLAGATVLPFAFFDTEGFTRSHIGLSGGARIGLLRESFVVPAASISVLYRRLGTATLGDVCRGVERSGECFGTGDMGEVAFDLTDLSTRLAVSRRFLGIAVAGGIGYDRFSSDVSYAVRQPVTDQVAAIFRSPEMELRSDRWSAFGNLGYNFLLTTLVVEAGWMQGQSPIQSYTVRGFDPRGGTWFGSIGGRIGI
jgi:hypothetical protein